jgi:hypothetical protein
MSVTDPRYPIGRLQREEALDPARRMELISQIEDAPAAVRSLLATAGQTDWEATYRPGGWTVRQVVHHLADSHMNAFIRFRLGLTEETPTIKPYSEAAWALLPDNGVTDPEVSLVLLEALHRRWVDLLRSIPDESFQRDVYHPEQQRKLTLDDLLVTYAWHGRHHAAHVREARNLLLAASLPEMP